MRKGAANVHDKRFVDGLWLFGFARKLWFASAISDRNMAFGKWIMLFKVTLHKVGDSYDGLGFLETIPKQKTVTSHFDPEDW